MYLQHVALWDFAIEKINGAPYNTEMGDIKDRNTPNNTGESELEKPNHQSMNESVLD